MHPIILKVSSYLTAAQDGGAEMPSHLVGDAANTFQKSLVRQFVGRDKSNFTLRMSNIGRPVCQLWYQKNNTPAEPEPYSFIMKMIYGDAVEVAAIAVMQAAGVNITKLSQKVTLPLSVDNKEYEINGNTDLAIDEGDGEKIYDLKSASSFAFSKFADPMGIEKLLESDDFGYLAQGIGYSLASGLPFGGWIVVNKETGEWTVLELTEEQAKELEPKIKLALEATIRSVESPEFPGRQFEDVPEMFRRKATGNRILHRTCSYCPYKWTCWPTIKHEPQSASTARDPKLLYYTELNDAH